MKQEKFLWEAGYSPPTAMAAVAYPTKENLTRSRYRPIAPKPPCIQKQGDYVNLEDGQKSDLGISTKMQQQVATPRRSKQKHMRKRFPANSSASNLLKHSKRPTCSMRSCNLPAMQDKYIPEKNPSPQTSEMRFISNSTTCAGNSLYPVFGSPNCGLSVDAINTTSTESLMVGFDRARKAVSLEGTERRATDISVDAFHGGVCVKGKEIASRVTSTLAISSAPHSSKVTSCTVNMPPLRLYATPLVASSVKVSDLGACSMIGNDYSRCNSNLSPLVAMTYNYPSQKYSMNEEAFISTENISPPVDNDKIDAAKDRVTLPLLPADPPLRSVFCNDESSSSSSLICHGRNKNFDTHDGHDLTELRLGNGFHATASDRSAGCKDQLDALKRSSPKKTMDSAFLDGRYMASENAMFLVGESDHQLLWFNAAFRKVMRELPAPISSRDQLVSCLIDKLGLPIPVASYSLPPTSQTLTCKATLWRFPQNPLLHASA